MEPTWQSDNVTLYRGDCREILPTIRDVHSIVTDPPYELGFMGKGWDKTGIAFSPDVWKLCLDALRPGGYLLAFGGARTYHRIACAIEDAGFEIRDCIMWLYGSGFPKGKSCLKPAHEPIVVARRPGKKVEPLNIDECRVPAPEGLTSGGQGGRVPQFMSAAEGAQKTFRSEPHDGGRWPANVIHDGSEEVKEAFAAFGEKTSGKLEPHHASPDWGYRGGPRKKPTLVPTYGDTGSASRFFYAAKASKSDRGTGNTHPTVKPQSLMRYLVKLVTPKGGTVLEPFAGSGTTLLAARAEGYDVIGIEQNPEYVEIIKARLLAERQGSLIR